MAEKEAKILDSEAMAKDHNYEPPLNLVYVDSNTVGTETFTLGRTIIPPKAKNQRHFHGNCDAAWFVRTGKLRVFVGPDDDIKEYIVPENHFVYAPQGVIHGLENLTDEPAEVIFTYGNCPNTDAAGTVYIEEPHTTDE